MDVRFANDDLERLENDPNSDAGFEKGIVRKFRMRMQYIRSALDERDFYSLKSLHYEKLKGKRSRQHSMKLYDYQSHLYFPHQLLIQEPMYYPNKI